MGDIQNGQHIKRLNGEPSFDYGGVSSSVANFLRGQADRIRRYVGTSIVKTGKDLLAAKHYLSHGAFLRWVESEVGIPARTAQGYMQVAQWVGTKNATVAHLPPSVLYTLSARSTPKEFTAGVLVRIDAGEHISPHSIRKELKDFRQARRAKLSNGQNGTPVTALLRDDRPQEEPAELDGQATVADAIYILQHSLSAADFIRVRQILTSNRVLDDPQLPQKILAAFMTIGTQATNGRAEPVPLNLAN
jgi:hypothetical protein